MSALARYDLMKRRLWPVGLAGAVLVTAAAMPSGALAAAHTTSAAGAVRAAAGAVHAAAGATRVARAAQDNPTEVIDAQTDPDKAGAELSSGCADLSNCKWQTDKVTAGYGPASILGDELYNCSTDPNDVAETSVEWSDERAESTSISEKISVKLSLGLIGFADSSVEFEAFSKQAETFSTKVTVENAVSVPAGYYGYTTTRVLSALVTGNTYITEGINKLIEVKDINMSFPGYQTSYDQSDSRIQYNGIKGPMGADQISSRCGAVNENPTAVSHTSSGLLGAARPTVPKVRTGSFKLAVCRPNGSCVTRKATGPRLAVVGQATASLTARGATYAVGTANGGRVRLTTRLPVRPGEYTLTLHGATRRRARSVSYSTTIVPITVS